jgi:hypothetical protein
MGNPIEEHTRRAGDLVAARLRAAEDLQEELLREVLSCFTGTKVLALQVQKYKY